MKNRIAFGTLVGAAGFAVGAVYSTLGFRFDPMPPLGGFTGLVGGFFLHGVVGAAILAYFSRTGEMSVSRILGFGVGFTIPAFIVPLATMTGAYESGASGSLAPIVGYAIAFALAGAIGAPGFLRGRVGGCAGSALLGALLFGFGGGVGGLLHRALPPDLALFGLPAPLIPFFLEMAATGAIGGALFGAAAGYAEGSEGPLGSEFRQPKRRRGLAVAVVAMAVLAVAMAVAPGWLALAKTKRSVARGTDLNPEARSEKWHGVDIPKSSSLHEAAMYGDAKSAAYLVESGAQVDRRRADGWTPLHLAALNGETEVARVLIEKGADVDARADNGDTALHLALGRTNPSVDFAEVLLANGADAGLRNADAETPLETLERLGIADRLKDRHREVYDRLLADETKANDSALAAAMTASANEPFLEIRNRDFSAKVRAMNPSDRRAFLESLRGERVDVRLRAAEIRPEPRFPNACRIRSSISNGIGVHVLAAPGEACAALRRGQLLRVRGTAQGAFYALGVQILIGPNAAIEPLE
ncbi:ankyrin repeat domain-containing protein [Candidatus Sumerlaeota bacterium]|nr:ankyrin repeat domain-containing protein [Candidatus Sumerlaeota bacterium]